MQKMLLLCFICIANPANAVSITYEAIDLPDTTLGEDLWEYRYTVSGSLAANEGFSIFFDPLNYASLESPAPTVNPDWDVLVLQPDAFLPDDGVYDALALANNPSLSDTFNLSFVWLGAGTPGSQPFVVYDSAFAVIATGNTLASGTSVPEPTTAFLLGSGLLALLGARNSRKSKCLPINT